MASRPLTSHKAESLTRDSFGFGIQKRKDYSTSKGSGLDSEPQKIIAGYMSPACEHDWLKLGDELQTLESEGKTIWKCRSCDEITNTYSWQTP